MYQNKTEKENKFLHDSLTKKTLETGSASYPSLSLASWVCEKKKRFLAKWGKEEEEEGGKVEEAFLPFFLFCPPTSFFIFLGKKKVTNPFLKSFYPIYLGIF